MFGGRVVGHNRYRPETAHRRVDEQDSPRRFVLISEKSDGLATDISTSPEIRIEHLSRILLRVGLGFTQRNPACVVEDDIDTSECLFGFGECIFDVLNFVDVEFGCDELGCWILGLEVVQYLGLPSCCDNNFAFLQ